MADAIAEARKTLEVRLTELRAEVKAIERALKALPSAVQLRDGSKGSTKGQTSKSGSRSGSGRQRSGRRAEQVLTELKKDSKASASTIAEELGMSASHVHGVFRSLEKRGKIKKTKQGRVPQA